ncbi:MULTISPECIES: DUF378 domain-containing protein [Sporosarcina]|uniref:DUF378 domain-containing protein n=1 Tax=Sporosarcina contaminans TaxID=633403 RepID=A0ABW3U021_9BACL
MNNLQKVALAITIIGALNWGVIGLFNFDVVAQLTGGNVNSVSRFIYIIVGIAGIVSLWLLFNPEPKRERYRMTEAEKL